MIKKRLQILNDYKKDILQFAKFNLLAILIILFFSLVIMNTTLILKPLENLICIVVFLVMFITLFLQSFNRNYLLLMSSILIWAYVGSMVGSLLGVVFYLVFLSFVYEIIFRFGLGIEIKAQLKELSWCQHRKKEIN